MNLFSLFETKLRYEFFLNKKKIRKNYLNYLWLRTYYQDHYYHLKNKHNHHHHYDDNKDEISFWTRFPLERVVKVFVPLAAFWPLVLFLTLITCGVLIYYLFYCFARCFSLSHFRGSVKINNKTVTAIVRVSTLKNLHKIVWKSFIGSLIWKNRCIVICSNNYICI